MDQRVKALWLEALRSGEYEQGNGALQIQRSDQVYFCCLGVLCDVAVKDGLEVDVVEASGVVYYNGQMSFPPQLVSEWAGVYTGGYHPRWQNLAYLNDTERLSFEQIADHIESGNWENS